MLKVLSVIKKGGRQDRLHKDTLDEHITDLRDTGELAIQELLYPDPVPLPDGQFSRLEEGLLGAGQLALLRLAPFTLGLLAGDTEHLLRVLRHPQVAPVALRAGPTAKRLEVVAEVAVTRVRSVGAANIPPADVAHLVPAGTGELVAPVYLDEGGVAARAHALDGHAHGLLDLRAQRDERGLVARVDIDPLFVARQARHLPTSWTLAGELESAPPPPEPRESKS
ncbi:hypothetical protein AX14_009038 [Amanita brunnescens Koide BX004]|nr:hypothetical protein AX14_009038 [Amanita brunnescens Koide BX004]